MLDRRQILSFIHDDGFVLFDSEREKERNVKHVIECYFFGIKDLLVGMDESVSGDGLDGRVVWDIELVGESFPVFESVLSQKSMVLGYNARSLGLLYEVFYGTGELPGFASLLESVLDEGLNFVRFFVKAFVDFNFAKMSV